MHSNVTIKNVSWPHCSWPTLYTFAPRKLMLYPAFLCCCRNFMNKKFSWQVCQLCLSVRCIIISKLVSPFMHCRSSFNNDLHQSLRTGRGQRSLTDLQFQLCPRCPRSLIDLVVCLSVNNFS